MLKPAVCCCSVSSSFCLDAGVLRQDGTASHPDAGTQDTHPQRSEDLCNRRC